MQHRAQVGACLPLSSFLDSCQAVYQLRQRPLCTSFALRVIIVAVSA